MAYHLLTFQYCWFILANRMYKTISRCPICNSEETASTLICTDHTVSNESFSISKCDNCGLLFTNPIPENLSSYYESEDYISHKKSDRTLIGQIYGVVRRRSIKNKYSLINREPRAGSCARRAGPAGTAARPGPPRPPGPARPGRCP